MVELIGTGPPLAESDVVALKLTLGVILPADYRAFLLRWNGGVPEPADFPIE